MWSLQIILHQMIVILSSPIHGRTWAYWCHICDNQSLTWHTCADLMRWLIDRIYHKGGSIDDYNIIFIKQKQCILRNPILKRDLLSWHIYIIIRYLKSGGGSAKRIDSTGGLFMSVGPPFVCEFCIIRNFIVLETMPPFAGGIWTTKNLYNPRRSGSRNSTISTIPTEIFASHS